MRRRQFIALLGGAAAWPLAARAQKVLPTIGFLNPASADSYEHRLRGFQRGLKEIGFVEGENVAVEYRWAENRLDRVPALAADLVRRRVSVIVTGTSPATSLAAKVATTTIPVVFVVSGDPVGLGLVSSLARPGGNLTGVNFFNLELLAKRLAILHDIVPSATRVAILIDLSAGTPDQMARDVGEAASSMGLEVQILRAATAAEIDEAFAKMAADRPNILFTTGGPLFNTRRLQLTMLAVRYGIVASYASRDYPEAGGLMSYGTDVTDAFRQAGIYAGRVLKGAKAADLPVVQANQIRTGNQPPNGPNSWASDPAIGVGRRRRGDRVTRRDFITLLGGAGAGWPLAARAQQPGMPVVGFLNAVSAEGFAERLRAFRQGLKDNGYVEGENVRLEYRWAENQIDRLPAMAIDLVHRQVAVITATGGSAPALAAKAATTTIPVVFGSPEDPVKLGLVASLSRPGGNMTGINFFTADLVAKQLGLLRELVPHAVRVAVLINPAYAARAAFTVDEAEDAARVLGLQIQIFKASSTREINAAFATFLQERPDALFVAPDPFFVGRRVQLANLAARHVIPASYSTRDFPEAGGLMSYGTDIPDAYRQVGVYTGRVLKGAKPADMPVAQSTKFQLVINLQTALLLGLTVPPTLLAAPTR